MSEHPGLEFALKAPRSPILPSMPPQVLFIISMSSGVFFVKKIVMPHVYHFFTLTILLLTTLTDHLASLYLHHCRKHVFNTISYK